MDSCGKMSRCDLGKLLTVFWDLDFGGKRKWPKGAGGIKKMVYFIFLVPLNPLYPILNLQKTHINKLTI